MNTIASEKIAFGGGCHWCTEAVFQSIEGVYRVDQGYISSNDLFSQFSEAVIVHYNPTVIELSALIRIHLNTHSSTSNHRMREKYRSAIYTFNPEQHQRALEILNFLQKDLSMKFITRVLPFRRFKPSAEIFQNYYLKDPIKPFCRTYITPKLRVLEDEYSEYLKK